MQSNSAWKTKCTFESALKHRNTVPVSAGLLWKEALPKDKFAPENEKAVVSENSVTLLDTRSMFSRESTVALFGGARGTLAALASQ